MLLVATAAEELRLKVLEQILAEELAEEGVRSVEGIPRQLAEAFALGNMYSFGAAPERGSAEAQRRTAGAEAGMMNL